MGFICVVAYGKQQLADNDVVATVSPPLNSARILVIADGIAGNLMMDEAYRFYSPVTGEISRGGNPDYRK